jgi:hypothetical protein
VQDSWVRKKPVSERVVDGHDNLFDTLPGDPGAHGSFDDQARGSTLWTRLRFLLPKGR